MARGRWTSMSSCRWVGGAGLRGLEASPPTSTGGWGWRTLQRPRRKMGRGGAAHAEQGGDCRAPAPACQGPVRACEPASTHGLGASCAVTPSSHHCRPCPPSPQVAARPQTLPHPPQNWQQHTPLPHLGPWLARRRRPFAQVAMRHTTAPALLTYRSWRAPRRCPTRART